MTPIVRPTRLADLRVAPPVFVAATISRHFPADRMAAVEAAWDPVRQVLAAARLAAGVPLENSHWDWRNKVDRARRGELTLFAVECEGEVQGLMAVDTTPRPATLTPGRGVLYVDYLEAAPWNQSAPGFPQRFKGVGKAMLGAAVVAGMAGGTDGRVGLHSLDQSVRFYEAGCRMSRVGPDPTYQDLVYFEYADGAGAAWLAAEGIPV